MDKRLYEQRISSKKVFSGKILGLYFDQVRLPNGNTASREKVTHPGAVGIVPINRDREVYLVRQYRYPPDKILIEIPAGKLDEDEDPRDCAQRELKEEIGAEGGEIVNLANFYTTPGFCNELLRMYLATGFNMKANNLDEDEFLQVLKFNLDDAIAMIGKSEIRDAKTIIGLMLARDYLDGR
ncbi:MAG: NUDIX hydrolase [Actinomycetota bacterium]